MVKYEKAIKYVIKDAVGIFCLGVAASFDGGMIILMQRVSTYYFTVIGRDAHGFSGKSHVR